MATDVLDPRRQNWAPPRPQMQAQPKLGYNRGGAVGPSALYPGSGQSFTVPRPLPPNTIEMPTPTPKSTALTVPGAAPAAPTGRLGLPAPTTPLALPAPTPLAQVDLSAPPGRTAMARAPGPPRVPGQLGPRSFAVDPTTVSGIGDIPQARGRLARAAIRVAQAGPAIAGTVANAAADKLLAPSPGAAAPGTGVPQGIPGIGDMQPVPAQAPSFFRDTEVGRNVGNIINAIPGARPIAGPLFRAGSMAQRATAVGGEMVRAAASSNALDKPPQFPQPAPQDIGAPLPTPQQIEGAVAPGDIGAGAGRGLVNPPNVQPGGVVTRDGNSFSGQNIGEGFVYADGSKSPNPINVVPGGGTGGTPSVDAALAAARSAAADRGDFGALGLPGGSAAGLTGGGVSGINLGGIPQGAQRNGQVTALNADQFDRDRAKHLSEQALRLGGRAGPAQANAINQAAATQAGEREARLRDTTGLAIAQGQTASHAAIAGAQDRTARRGQDIGAMAHASSDMRALDVANVQASSHRDVAQKNYEGRIAAAEEAARRYIPVAGGQEMRDIGGMPQAITLPGAVFDQRTGTWHHQQSQTPTVPTPPPGAVTRLKGNPKKFTADFDVMFGPGAAAAALAR